MIKAIIIEDESSSRITLQNMVSDFCNGVEVVDAVESVEEGVKSIQSHQPDLIFLDIELPVEDGFKLFDYFPKPKFEVIFTTAYKEYALNAIKMSALDYLLKPIDLEELRNAIQKVKTKKKNVNQKMLAILKENLNREYSKIALPTTDGLFFVKLKEIIQCEAQGNYTMFYLEGNKKVLVSKTLKTYNELLEPFNFYRISRSNLINLSFIKKFGRQKCPTVTMEDGSILNVSLSRKDEFISIIENMI